MFCGSACAHGHARANHVEWHHIVNIARYGFILRQELGVDLTSTFGYIDLSKDSIWIRRVSKSIKISVTFERNSKVDSGRMVPFPPLGLYIYICTIGIYKWFVAQTGICGCALDTPQGLDFAHFSSL